MGGRIIAISKDKVVTLDGQCMKHEGNPDPEVVKKLEEMLEAAKRGRLTCFSGACKLDAEYHHFIVGSGLMYEMIGGLEMAKASIITLSRDD